MDILEILTHVDHTLLKADATWPDIDRLCREAVDYHTASVCIPPRFVARARAAYPDLNICTVIGFPLGYSVLSSKAEEARQAIADGANEIDMVIDIGAAREHNYDYLAQEIRELRDVTRGHILKVIIETCYLNEEEKVALCELVTDCEADYIKTSTGFGSAGATLEDVKLFTRHIGPEVRIKAAGGIRTQEDMEAYLAAGADRIGASAAVKLAEAARDL